LQQSAAIQMERFGNSKIKTTPWPLVRKPTIPERPPHVGEVSANFLRIEGVAWSAQRIPSAINSVFLTGAATFSFKQFLNYHHEAEWTPVPDPLVLRKSGSAGNRTRDSGTNYRLDHVTYSNALIFHSFGFPFMITIPLKWYI
jgi:hypothetical protein